MDSCTNFAMVTNHTVAPCVITLVLYLCYNSGSIFYKEQRLTVVLTFPWKLILQWPPVL